MASTSPPTWSTSSAPRATTNTTTPTIRAANTVAVAAPGASPGGPAGWPPAPGRRPGTARSAASPAGCAAAPPATRRCTGRPPRPAGTPRPGAAARCSRLEGPDQLLLAVVAQAGLDHGRVERLDGLDRPVGGGRAGEHEHRRLALLELLADLLDGVVVDADVGQLPSQGAGAGPDGQPGQRHEEQHADQGAPQGARGRPGPGQADGLVDADLALVVLVGVGIVSKLNKLLL